MCARGKDRVRAKGEVATAEQEGPQEKPATLGGAGTAGVSRSPGLSIRRGGAGCAAESCSLDGWEAPLSLGEELLE